MLMMSTSLVPCLHQPAAEVSVVSVASASRRGLLTTQWVFAKEMLMTNITILTNDLEECSVQDDQQSPVITLVGAFESFS